MNFLEAINSKKPFKRKVWVDWRYKDGITGEEHDRYPLVSYESPHTELKDMLEDDWEIKKETKKVTLFQYFFKETNPTRKTPLYKKTGWTSTDWDSEIDSQAYISREEQEVEV